MGFAVSPASGESSQPSSEPPAIRPSARSLDVRNNPQYLIRTRPRWTCLGNVNLLNETAEPHDTLESSPKCRNDDCNDDFDGREHHWSIAVSLYLDNWASVRAKKPTMCWSEIGG